MSLFYQTKLNLNQIKAIDVRIFEINAEKCSLEKYIQEDLRNLECKKMEN